MMESTKKRIFVGNLPCDMSESDVKERFSKFGNVLKIEIKSSNNVAQSCYAFLDLEIDASLLGSCFRSLSKDNWNGHSIKLELAKESFLSRLQRERQEENSKTSQAVKHEDSYKVKLDKQISPSPTVSGKKIKFLVVGDTDSQRKKEVDVDAHHIHSDIVTVGKKKKRKKNSAEEPLEKGLLQKFESFSDVWKDPPTSNTTLRPKKRKYNYDAEDGSEIVPQHKKDRSKVECRPTSEFQEVSTRNRSFDSEDKRLKSIAARQTSFLQQKQAVALALSSVDSNIKTNKKIIFDDDDGVNEEIAPSNDGEKSRVNPRKGARGPKLFEEEMPGEEEQDYDFNIRRQFEGRKGQKLLGLQSKYADDKRFALDDRFYESDDNAEDEDETNAMKEGSIEEERRRQIEILQSIVGSNLPLTQEERKGKQANVDSMVVHYDPTRDDHAKYEVKRDIPKKVEPVVTPKDTKLEKRAKKKQMKELPPVQVPSVSKEQFYKVSESLKESLKASDAKGFSLLETFGSIDNEGLTTNEDEYVCLPTNKRKPTHHTANPFKYDSSDSEDDNADSAPAKQVLSSSPQQQQPVQVQGIWRESFFFKPNDDRLSEGIKFFSQEEPSGEDFKKRRREVRQIVHAKVRHNIRMSASRGKTRGGRRKRK